MRVVVVILGLASLVASGYLGFQWMAAFLLEKDGIVYDRLRIKRHYADESTQAMVARFDRQAKAWPFLIAGCALGLLGALMALRRRRLSALALFLCAALGPAVFDPRSLVVTGGMLLAGLLALTIRPPRVQTAPIP